MNIHPEMTVGDLVSQHFRTADVFERHGIDFCCGGKKTLAKVCADKSINWDELVAELEKASQVTERAGCHADAWDPGFLADYIVQVHHRYLHENLPVVAEFAARISRVHGARHPELRIVEKQVGLLAADLLEHMEKEERILFPYVKSLDLASRQHKAAPGMPFGSIQNPIGVMENEHDYAGSLLDSLRELTGDFTPPEDACVTYRAAFEKLKELDEDLRWHVHLENNILFPKTILLEKQLLQP